MAGRKKQAYMKKYGEKVGTKLHKLMQQKSNLSSQLKKFKKKEGLEQK